MTLTETRRLTRHFDSTLALLSASSVSGISRSQQRRRAHCVNALAQYRARRRFPKNERFAARTPFFVDRFETRCAMAHLIEQSGGRALVERVATEANNALIEDLASDMELRDWLFEHGMTMREAAGIQPGYGPCWKPNSDVCKRSLAEQAAQHQAAVSRFCDGAPLGNLYRVVALDPKSARVVQAYVLDSGLGTEAKIEIPNSITLGHEFLVRNVAGHWTVLPHRLTAEIAYLGSPLGGSLIAIPLADVGVVLTSRSCAAQVAKLCADHPELLRLAVAAPEATTAAPASAVPSASTTATSQGSQARDNAPVSRCGCDVVKSNHLQPQELGSLALTLLIVATRRATRRS